MLFVPTNVHVGTWHIQVIERYSKPRESGSIYAPVHIKLRVNTCVAIVV